MVERCLLLYVKESPGFQSGAMLELQLSKVLFVQVAVTHLLQNQHFRQTG